MADVTRVMAVLAECARVIEARAAYLTELDAAIGDADHGTNMAKGFRAVREKVLAAQPPSDVGSLLKNTGLTLVGSVGGASGPLYGTAFMRAGQALAGRSEAGPGDLVAALEAALEGVCQRGKATQGEKTMVDAIAPAVAALKAALAGGAAKDEALVAMVDAARRGRQATVAIRATKGRASYLGDRSIGHQDPGATSAYLLLAATARALGAPVVDPATAEGD